MKSFLDFLQSIHGKDYVGTSDCMPDDFNDWLQGQDISDICEYAEKFALLTRRELREEIEELKNILAILVDCPHFIDEATVSKEGIEINPEQVVLQYSIGWVRIQKARALLKKLEKKV